MEVKVGRTIAMNARQTEMSKLLVTEQDLSVQSLVARFGVSDMTIRRDLKYLESLGLAVRTRGGAMAAGKLRFLQNGFGDQPTSPEKKAIGKLAASLVEPGQTAMVDNGSTTFEVALQLPTDSGVTLATPSLRVAQALYRAGVSVLVLGGFLRDDIPGVSGPLTELFLSNMRVDTLFIGCDAADSTDGLFMKDMQVASLEKAMLNAAHRVVLATESVKFERRGFMRFASISDISILVTDPHLSERDRTNLEQQGVQVLIAEPECPPQQLTPS